MTNFQVYRKTLVFSLVMFLIDLLSLIIVGGLATVGFLVMNKSNDMALIGLGVGLILGIIISVLISIFITNRIKAGQIAMMTIGVVDNKLPDHVFSAGLAEVKGRFAKLTLFFMVTNAIKGIFRQLGRALNKLGTAIGGDAGNTVTSVIDSAIQTLIGYLCDCCLGWVMYNKEKGVARAACEGAVIFFKHGKTLIRNIGRIFGMGLLSLIIVGGIFFGVSYLVLNQMPQGMQSLSQEIAELSVRHELDIPAAFKDPQILTLIISGVIGIIFWSMIHSVLIRPFILVGVLRNFMKAGLAEEVKDEDLKLLDAKSPKFAKLHNSI